ncbi:hypothetical protein SAMN05443999_101233 [Roseovarius azorensis]|uniref:Transcriptional regulator n=1 Tax=Roseovarius azorensis TaxID=1287727 RepID=A0A1H7G5L1_9RHOB|nr:hypothetical protein [Roseovarius azorensis]SEK33421.1 hypothetical protein SAMN05443999_101233 [Roseovarius azorensis]
MSALDTARQFWGDALPDWVAALARACDETSQNKVARRLERSASLVSNVLRNRYPADLGIVEDLVRGHLMSEDVDCPVKGRIGKQVCRKWRGRARQFGNVNADYITMYRACNRCPLNNGGEA